MGCISCPSRPRAYDRCISRRTGKHTAAHTRLPQGEHNLKRRVRSLVLKVRHQPMQACLVNARSLDVIHDHPARASQPLNLAAMLHAKTFVTVMLAFKAVGVCATVGRIRSPRGLRPVDPEEAAGTAHL